MNSGEIEYHYPIYPSLDTVVVMRFKIPRYTCRAAGGKPYRLIVIKKYTSISCDPTISDSRKTHARNMRTDLPSLTTPETQTEAAPSGRLADQLHAQN